MCHLLTRYQSTIFPNHKSCVRKKGVPVRYVTVIYPQKKVDTSMKISARIKKAMEDKLEVEVKIDGKKCTLKYQL